MEFERRSFTSWHSLRCCAAHHYLQFSRGTKRQLGSRNQISLGPSLVDASSGKRRCDYVLIGCRFNHANVTQTFCHGLQIYCIIALFDYFQVTPVWIKFWWRDRTLAWFRKRFCNPSETANTKCAVPVFKNITDANDWCLENHQSTDCVTIRDNAQAAMQRSIYVYYYANAAWAILLGFLVRDFVAVLISCSQLTSNRIFICSAIPCFKDTRKHHLSPACSKI